MHLLDLYRVSWSVGFSFAYFAFLIAVAVLTMSTTHASSSQDGMGISSAAGRMNIPGPVRTKRTQPWYILQRRRPQVLAFIVTDKPDAVAKRILSELKRGATSMIGEDNTVLICAVSAKEIGKLRDVVAVEDIGATVNVSSAQDIWGKGFDPLANGS